MRSHIFRMICLAAGAGALFAACGGAGDEKPHSILAVAFRLDAGTPVMAAYVGDPEEDPFVLPAGEYYIEALDQEEIGLPLGAVDLEDGDTVAFPASFADAAGEKDTQRAESLKEVAAFLLNVQLLEYVFLDYATAELAEPPFVSDAPPTAAQLETMLEVYRDIADRGDALMAALAEVEDRVSVLDRTKHVGLSPAPREEGEDIRDVTDRVRAFLDMIREREKEAGLEPGLAVPDDSDFTEADFDLFMRAVNFDAAVHGSLPPFVGDSPDLRARQEEWRRYAENLLITESYFADDPDWSTEGAASQLSHRIRSDMDAWRQQHHPEWGEDWFEKVTAQWLVPFMLKLLEDAKIPPVPAAGKTTGPAATPSDEPSPTPTPDASWIEAYVQGIADQWLTAGYGGIGVAVAADDLRLCLTDAWQGGADREAAIGECPTSVFEPEGSPEPTEAQTPTSAPTAPPGVPISATGTFDFGNLGGATLTQNTMSLTWNTAGGPIISGTGSWRMQVQHYCGTEWESWSGQFSGAFDPVLNTFSGEYTVQWARLNFHREPDGSCVQDPTSGTSTSQWTATLSGSSVAGDAGYPFHLTIGGGGSASGDARGDPFLLDSYFAAAIPSASRTPLLRPL